MRRRLLNLLTSLSLIMFLGLCARWVMSHTPSAGAQHRLHMTAGEGLYLHTVALDAGAVEYRFSRRSNAPPARGFYIDVWITGVPLAVPGIALLGVVLLLIRWHRKLPQFQGAGLCPACGYDLRATPGRCPECGTMPRPQPAP